MKKTKEKLKAKELIESYLKASFNCSGCNVSYCNIPCTRLNIKEAKECAKLAVKDLKELMFDVAENPIYTKTFWEDVENEIVNYNND